jgi:Ethanolamine utilization protein EutJ (predicted chaperonin)
MAVADLEHGGDVDIGEGTTGSWLMQNGSMTLKTMSLTMHLRTCTLMMIDGSCNVLRLV